MRLLAVDPGIRGCGCAVFCDAVLERAAYVENYNLQFKEGRAAAAYGMALSVYNWAGPINELVVEWPQVYASRIRQGHSFADPNDLLALAAVDGAVAALYSKVTYSPRPAQWKQQLKKEIVEQRVRARLDATETAVLDAAVNDAGKLWHNVVDAVGIGLSCFKHRWGLTAWKEFNERDQIR